MRDHWFLGTNSAEDQVFPLLYTVIVNINTVCVHVCVCWCMFAVYVVAGGHSLTL